MATLGNSEEKRQQTFETAGDSSFTTQVEIRGVAAGPFDPKMWQNGRLNLLPDARHPVLEPRPGEWRNIYAPSIVEIEDAWRVFYGAWDGVPDGKDRIYSATTTDFLEFKDRHTVIEHGVFQHVCNVSAIESPSGGFDLMCTAYPDKNNTNKPAYFSSPDGKTWNGSPAPYPADYKDLIEIQGYEGFEKADINGMNVLLHESGKYRLYFCDFKNFGKIFRASAEDPMKSNYDGVALAFPGMVNDVKKFRVGDENWYLMGIHWNKDQLFYSLSKNGLEFQKEQPLLHNLDESDQYIVAIGWVVSGEQEKAGRRVLGLLYGAGAVPQLDKNRIFARWLQKKIVFTSDDGKKVEGTRSYGPDRQLLDLGDKGRAGKIEIFSEDGATRLGVIENVKLELGKAYSLSTPLAAE